ncbi:tyrosine-type recombinase/integrase [Streptomyces sp. HMX87]|uniref:tyrosine-type recombinase/integrase n=1 Tax=Streptomyces sp. HMX87 TaxID=3390849 RepID=UPI003A85741C
MTTADFFDLSALNADRLAERTIDQIADAYRELKALKSQETADRYRKEIDFFLAFMRKFGADPAHPTQPHVSRYLAYLASEQHPDHPGPCWHECKYLPYAPASRQHRLDVLRDFYDYAIANGLRLPANPCTGLIIHVPKPDKIDHLTEWEARDLWTKVREKSARDAVVVGLGLGCGQRKEESILSLAENLGENAFGPTLRFWRVKGRYWQTINLPLPVHEAITTLLNGRTEGPILLTGHRPSAKLGKGLTPQGVDHIIKEIRGYTGVRPDDFHHHLMRKTSITFARTLKGLALETTMTFYGHQNLRDHHRYDAFARDTFVREIRNPAQERGFWRLAA